MPRTTIASLLLALVLAVPAGVQTAIAQTTGASGGPRLAIGFLTASFLADAAARVEVARLREERRTGAYLQPETGLVWTTSDNGTDIDWYQAIDYCRDLEYAGWSDWRLPSLDELQALHERRSEAVYKLPAGFKLTACCPWSTDRSGDGSGWNYSFRHRQPFLGSLNYSFQLRALCVRPATAADVAFYDWVAAEAKRPAKGRRPGS